MGLARVGARPAHGDRSGARHLRLGRPASPTRRRSAVLRVLPSRARQRTDRVRRDRADPRARRQPARVARTARTRSTMPTPRSSTRSRRASPAWLASTSATSSSSRWSTSCGATTTASARSRRLSPLPGLRNWVVAQLDADCTHAGRGRSSRSRRASGAGSSPNAASTELARPALLSLGARYLDRRRATVGRSTRWPTSTCRTAHRWSGSTGWPTRRRTGSWSRSASWSTTATTARRSPGNAAAYLADGTISASNQVRGLVKTTKR